MDDQSTPAPRQIQIGGTQFVEDESTLGLSVEELRQALRPAFPELAYATVRQHEEDGVTYLSFEARAGSKG
jgi:hypothetical protein